MIKPQNFAVVALGLVLIYFSFGIARNWNPFLSYDTVVHYFPPVLNSRSESLVDRVVSPFLVPESERPPEAAAAKPVFMAALQIWDASVHGLFSNLSDSTSYSWFISTTFLLSIISVFALGVQLGGAWVGLVGTAIAFLNPWAFEAVYFNSYTALSIAMLCLMVRLPFRDKARPIFAGVLAAALCFENQSCTVFIASFVVVAVLAAIRSQDRRKSLILFFVGIFGAAILVEGSIFIYNLLGHNVNQLSVTLSNYLLRSGVERTEFFEAYQKPIFLWLAWFTFGPAILAIPALITMSTLQLRQRATVREPSFRVILWSMTLLAFAMIDLRSGPKFARTYFLLVPFFSVLATDLYFSVRKTQPRIAYFGICILLFLVVKESKGLAYLRNAALSTRDAVEEAIQNRSALFVEGEDTYFRFFAQSVEDKPQLMGKIFRVTSLCDLTPAAVGEKIFALSGMNQHSVVNLPGPATGPMSHFDLGPASRVGEVKQGDCGGHRWIATADRKIPFFGLHPLFVLEDPSETYRFLVKHDYGFSDWREGAGSNTLWSVQLETRK